LSVTQYSKLLWGFDKTVLEKMHILFMKDDIDDYIEKLFAFNSN